MKSPVVKSPILMSGSLYFIDEEIELNKETKINKLLKEAKAVKELEFRKKLSRANIIPIEKVKHEKLIFDIEFPASFRGFIYPDNKFLGYVEYPKEDNYPKEKMEGFYKRISKYHILLWGTWLEDEKIKIPFCIELKRSNS